MWAAGGTAALYTAALLRSSINSANRRCRVKNNNERSADLSGALQAYYAATGSATLASAEDSKLLDSF